MVFLFIPSLSYAFEVGDCHYGGLVYGFTAKNTASNVHPPDIDPTEKEASGYYTGVIPFFYLANYEKYEGTGEDNHFAIKYNGVFYGKGTIKLHSYVNDGITAQVDGMAVLFTDDGGDSCWKKNPVEPYLRMCSGVFSVNEGYHLLTIKYFEAENVAAIIAGWNYPDPQEEVMPFPSDRFLSQGLRIEYYYGEFASEKFGTQTCGVEVIEKPSKDWGADVPCKGLSKEKYGDNWSSRWWGYLLIEKHGNYKICARSDEKARVYIDDVLVIDAWDAHSFREDCNFKDCGKSVYLNMGAHSLHIQHYDATGDAFFSLGWGNKCDGNVNTFEEILPKFLVLMGKSCKEPPKPFSKRIVESARGGGGIGCGMVKKGPPYIILFLPILYLIFSRKRA